MKKNAKIYIQGFNAICSLGNDPAAIEPHLFATESSESGRNTRAYSNKYDAYLSSVTSTCALPETVPQHFHNRNNGLIYQTLLGLQDELTLATKNCAPTRIGIVIGSSNAGIEEAEKALASHHKTGVMPPEFSYEQQEYGSPALFLAHILNTFGPAYTISTACSSSAKAFISGARLIQAGLCDVVLVGGSDTLSQLTVNGFLSLEALSNERSLPFSKNRSGIHLGEACALFILSKTPNSIELLGWGESSDAHHMSAPQPEGIGAQASMSQALSHAGLVANDIDYINLHGTATMQNDSMEAAAVAKVFPNAPWVSSTKSLTGHTLGAAGAIEAAFCCMTLSQEGEAKLPPHWWDGATDERLPSLRFVPPNTVAKPRYVLSNSFGFGGSNASLIFARA